jgi:FixJ family two-component response regulator
LNAAGLITACSEVQSTVRAINAGAVDFIEKPYKDYLLLNAIEARLRRERLHAWLLRIVEP